VKPLERARILTGDKTEVLPSALLQPERHRRLIREELEAREQAKAILAAARDEAQVIVATAAADGAAAARAAGEEAREAEHAKLAALYVCLRHEDEKRAERDLDRVVELAVLLAERLLGATLDHDPQQIVALARRALADARGARRAVIEASPLDAGLLEHHLDRMGLSPDALSVRPEPSLSRGSLRITTNLGTLDAQLRPQLERLAAALRDALR
jgi:flagellar biosynthesis/type III secretory pathway protein FliH